MMKVGYISLAAIIISVIASILSIAAICNVYPRELGIDYLGWIVGILALLTTVLLGWNIYTIIDIRESHRRYISVINVVKALNECFTNPKAVTITKSNKEQVLSLLRQVKQPSRIEGYMDLMEKVALIGIK